MPLAIPGDATFRRAEGLTIHLRPCEGLRTVEVLASRQGGDLKTLRTMDDARLLARMSHWHTAEELGVPHQRLVALVEGNCAFWSVERPTRALTGAPLGMLDGPIALRGNVTPLPVLQLAGDQRLHPFPQIPRLGELDRAELAGTQFVTVEWDTAVGAAVFSCCPHHMRLMRDLVVTLDGRHDAAELQADAEKRALLAALDDLGLLERHRARDRDGAPRVTWLGHAAVLYEAAGRRIAIDPASFYRSTPTRHAVDAYDLRDLGPLDAVLITHGDSDHLHPLALHRIDRRTPVVIPRAAGPQPYQVDMRRILELLGFERVLEVDEWQRLRFGEVDVVAAPFRGEDWGLSLPRTSYLLRGDGLTIYLNADSTSTPEAYERLASEFAIDLAFVGVTGNAESLVMPPGYGYGEFYTGWIPAEKHNQWVQHCNGPRESAEVARRLGARYAFGYAAGGASFYPLAYSDRGSHAELARCLEGSSTLPLELHIGVPCSVPCHHNAIPALAQE